MYNMSLSDMISASPIYSTSLRAGANQDVAGSLSSNPSDVDGRHVQNAPASSNGGATDDVVGRPVQYAPLLSNGGVSELSTVSNLDVCQMMSKLSGNLEFLQDSLKTHNNLLSDMIMQRREHDNTSGNRERVNGNTDIGDVEVVQRLQDIIQDMMKQQRGEIRNDVKLLLVEHVHRMAAPSDVLASPRIPTDLQGLIKGLLEEQLDEIRSMKAAAVDTPLTKPSFRADDEERSAPRKELSACSAFHEVETSMVHVQAPKAEEKGAEDLLSLEAQKRKLKRHIANQKLMYRQGQLVNYVSEVLHNWCSGKCRLLAKTKPPEPDDEDPDREIKKLALVQEELPMFVRVIERCVRTNYFGAFVSLIILANAVWIGWVSDFQIQKWLEDPEHPETKTWWRAMDTAFAIIFLVELILRLIAFRFSFFVGLGWKFNIFDLVVVTTSVIAVFSKNNNANLSVLRLVRLMRIFRMLAMFRVLPFFRELRHMLIVIIDSFRLVVWCFALMAFAGYVASIAIIEALLTESHKNGADHRDHQVIVGVVGKYYNSLPDSMVTLCYVVTGGISWGDMENELGKISFLVRSVLNVYVMVVFFCFLPVVYGQMFMNELREACNRVGYKQRAGILEEDDIERILHSAEIIMLFDVHRVEITADEAFNLFDMEDRDRREITLQEFLYGCQWLKLQGKHSDVVFLSERISSMGLTLQSALEISKATHRSVLKVQNDILGRSAESRKSRRGETNR